MDAIIILMVVAIFFINLFFIDNIYKIVDNAEEPSHKTKYTDRSLKDALVMGEDDMCQKINCELEKFNITSDVLHDIDDMDKSYPYKYVIAAFNDDLENLTVSSIAFNMMGITDIVAICNKKYNQKIYDENHIVTIPPHATASDMVSMLLNYHNKREA